VAGTTNLLTFFIATITLAAMKISLYCLLACAALSTSLQAAPVREGGVYDPEGHLIAYRYADGTKDLFTYDLKGQMVQFTSKAGEVTRFIYELDGSIVSLLADGRRIVTAPKVKE
jgi:YD repeat-containing protein